MTEEGLTHFRTGRVFCKAALTVALVIAGGALTSANAQGGGLAPARGLQDDRNVRIFDIEAQPLSVSLTRFGRQSGLRFSVPARLVAGRSSNSVSGRMLPLQALTQLLEGTGLTYRFVDGVVILETFVPSQNSDDMGQLRPLPANNRKVSG